MTRTVWILVGVGALAFLLAVGGLGVLISSESPPQADETVTLAAVPRNLELPLADDDPRALMLARRGGRILAGLAVVPGRAAEVAVVEGARAVTAERLTFVLAGRPAPSTPCGFACWRLPARPGALSVSVRGGPTFRFLLPGRLPPSGEKLYREAQREMTSLKSYRYREDLTSGVGKGTSSTFEIRAPDRARLRTADGFRSVLIANTRWDFQDGRWERTPFPGFRASFMWDGARHARVLRDDVLGRRPVRVISVFDREPVPAWFQLHVDVATRRVLQAEMLAPSHFMKQRFGAFNAPLRIEPPT